jgi:undecaprenyl pyrophosphate phosphatase UppP
MIKFFITILAVILVFEEWLWDVLKAQLHRLSRWPAVHRMEVRIRALSAWASLLVMLVPVVTVLPFKIAGLWALAHGHAVVGVVIFLLAKITGTALAAYFFDLVRDKARELNGFNVMYMFIMSWLQRAKSWLAMHPAYRSVRAMATRTKDHLRRRWHATQGQAMWSARVAKAKAEVLKFWRW